MEFILNLTTQSLEQVWLTLQHNWPFLLVSVIIATLLKLYMDGEKVSAFLSRYRGAGVAAATAAAITTPLCSCGTTAVVLGMMASTMPWAPIVAFMVASPLTSPEELVYSAGLFGWPFALAFFIASILLGFAGGGVAAWVEKRGWLANQARTAKPATAPCACSGSASSQLAPNRVFSLEVPGAALTKAGTDLHIDLTPACGCSRGVTDPVRESPDSGCACDLPAAAQRDVPVLEKKSVTPSVFFKELAWGGKNLLVMFVGFAFIGYFLNGLIPASWVPALFGGGHIYNVPLAATLGLPFYINTEASLPLVRALLDAGMSQGASLAFLIAGSGTSIGAISGALTIARWRVVSLVVGVLWLGAILSGFAFNLFLML
jgi:hypothetical protein